MTTNEIPLDDSALTLIEDALNGAYEVDEDGTHHLVGSEFTLHQLLDFWSGYDADKAIHAGYVGDVPLYEYPDPVFTDRCLIRALVTEVRRLRGTR